MKSIRWGGLVGFLVITGLVVTIALLFAGGIIKSLMESSFSDMNGAKVDIEEVNISYSPLALEIVNIQVADPAQPMMNTAEIEQIKFVIDSMPFKTDIEKRNRALIAFTILTGARDSAIASFKIKHIDCDAETIFQDAREVKTKFSKTFTSNFFPVGDDIRNIVIDWVNYLTEELLFGNDDPLFPKTNMINNKDRKFEASGLKPEHWSNASPIRKIFKEAFIHAGLDYFNPHTFRNTLTTLGLKICTSIEAFKAWSQSLGHEEVLTTLRSYGEVQPERQAEIFQELKKPQTTSNQDQASLAKALVEEMRNQKMIS